MSWKFVYMKFFKKIKDWYIRKLTESREKHYLVYFYDQYQMKWCMDDKKHTLSDAKRLVETVQKDGIKAFYMDKEHAIRHCLQ